MSTLKPSPKASIWMITYNHECFIAQALESILMQVVDFNYEIIIGEDCSTDSTREILKSYEAKYPDIVKPIYYETNVGMMQNMINVLKKCSGQYIALLEGDDYWTDPLKLQKQVDFLERNLDYVLVHTNYNRLDENNNLEISPLNVADSMDTKTLLQYNCIRTCTTLFRNDFNKLHSFEQSLPYGDWPLFLNISRNGYVKYFDEVTVVYRLGVGVTKGDSFNNPYINRRKVINWFVKNNPEYLMYGKYSLAIQYSEEIIKGKGPKENINELFKSFFKNYISTIALREKHVRINIFKSIVSFLKLKINL